MSITPAYTCTYRRLIPGYLQWAVRVLCGPPPVLDKHLEISQLHHPHPSPHTQTHTPKPHTHTHTHLCLPILGSLYTYTISYLYLPAAWSLSHVISSERSGCWAFLHQLLTNIMISDLADSIGPIRYSSGLRINACVMSSLGTERQMCV